MTTVADNMRQYTKREVEQAKTARELMARLGYPSSQATIDMLDAGVTNCAVTKQDVRNADAIFGSSAWLITFLGNCQGLIGYFSETEIFIFLSLSFGRYRHFWL